MATDLPRLSEMSDYLPLGASGSPELRALVRGVCTDREANLDFVRFLKRERLATPTHPTPSTSARLQKAQAND